MKRAFDKYKLEGLSFLVLFAAVFLVLALSFDFKDYRISMPISYQGGDDFGTAYKHAKEVSENSKWIFETDRLGAPYGANYYDFMPDSLMNVDVFLLKVFGMFSDDPVVVVNITIFFLFFVIAGTAYYSMRQLGMRNDFAIACAVLFDFTYYHFVRLINHFCLSAYEFVPLSILLCVWLWQDDKLFRFNRDFFKYKKNYAVIIMIFLIANNGIGYYPFFTCLFLAVTGFSKSIKEKIWQPMFQMIRMVGSILFFLIIALIPSLVYQIQNGANLTNRSVADSEKYALKIFQMLVPYKDYGIEKLQTLHREYYQVFELTETTTSYLGLVAAIGFIILLVGIFRSKSTKNDRRSLFTLFVELNVIAVLFATVGGFSSIFANFVSQLVRGVNRISIFIQFFSLSAIGMLMTWTMEKKNKRKWVKPAIYGIFVFVFVAGLVDAIPGNYTGYSQILEEEKQSDMNFINTIESRLPEGSMIYQLPYHPYPEGGKVNKMGDYQLLIGFLYSKDLRWSYGGSKGREGDLWNQSISMLPLDQMVNKLREKGFAGIYIDKRAYKGDIFVNLTRTLEVQTGNTAWTSNNGKLFFYKL